MVKRIILILLCTIPMLSISAGTDASGEAKTGAMAFYGTLTSASGASGITGALLGDTAITGEGFQMIYSASASPSLSYSSSSLKIDLEGKLEAMRMAGRSILAFSLEKAGMRFRLPSFGGRKMTITIGKEPISWGLGTYYRAGDVLVPISRNEKAGVSDSRSIWLAEVSQSLPGGFAFDIAASLPLPSDITVAEGGITAIESGRTAIGATVRKTFQDSWLKSLHAFYSYSEENIHKAAIAADLSLYFDITLGAESSFRSKEDARCVINMVRMFSAETETASIPIGLHISGELDFWNRKHEACISLSISPDDRTSLYFSIINAFDSKEYRGLAANASSSLLLMDNLLMETSLVYSYNRIINAHSGAISASMKASF
ncbi:MAG: hypothetical protein SPJ34_06780 [Candidatus Ornithospirochaeta sp.]|nr:hypothetical protein [Candidatus Ornithospirochaeta sp.]